MVFSSWGVCKPKVIHQDMGRTVLEHRCCHLAQLGCENCFLSGRLKTLVHQDPDTQNKAVHLMVERGAKWH